MNNSFKYFTAALLFCLIVSSNLYASVFVSTGTGGVLSGDDGGGEIQTDYGIPVLLGFQYSPEYRYSWMLNSSFSYIVRGDNSGNDNMFIGTAGLMFIKPFVFFESNITDTVMTERSCIGTILLPVAIMRDALTGIFQVIIPQHPLVFLDFALIKQQESDMFYGFSCGAGLTSGVVDIKLRYTQNVSYDKGFKRNIYIAGLEFTFNFPLQQNFLRKEPLIE
jgi:hypothetical protein